MKKFKENDLVKIINTGDIWEDKTGKVIEESEDEIITIDNQDLTLVTVKVNFGKEEENKVVIQQFPRQNLEKIKKGSITEFFARNKKITIKEEIKNKKINDFISKYIYIKDLDDKIVPCWIFASKIATGENKSESYIIEKAKELGYKLYAVEAYNFYKVAIAAKELKKEVIIDDYASYLLGDAVVYEI